MMYSSTFSLDTMAPSLYNNFENAKVQCLGKRDKSFAGRIDSKAVEICSLLNARKEYYTTSSCSGRCFLYRGDGTKTSTDFQRWRIAHQLITDAHRYFDLSTLDADPTGGADPIRSVDRLQHKRDQAMDGETETREGTKTTMEEDPEMDALSNQNVAERATPLDTCIATNDMLLLWLRYEPFILHVSCRSLEAAAALMAAARPDFKNVGLTSWKHRQSCSFSSYLVAIWGDEGLDMPLCHALSGAPLYDSPAERDWLAQLVNERHKRNWNKLDHFVQAVRDMPDTISEEESMMLPWKNIEMELAEPERGPKSFDVIGDVAVLHSIPSEDEDECQRVGAAILRKNKAIKICVVRTSTLEGPERAPGQDGMRIIAGPARSPLITSHTEYGIKCVVDLNQTFFSPRMGPERLRICQQVARGENVLVLFAGVGMEALQIVGRTEASQVTAIELNPVAVQCARRAQRMLERNKAVKCANAAERLRIIQGDVLTILPFLDQRNSFDRILAPRPKEGALDGDMGSEDGGVAFLEALLPLLKENGGECHWSDFVADHEFPSCERTKEAIEKVCIQQELNVKFINVTRVGSIAKRQLRVCVDFKLNGRRVTCGSDQDI